jgi:hypothetical protein
MFRSFYVTQSVVGTKAPKVAVFYLRAICCNRILWGVEGFEEMGRGAPLSRRTHILR